MQVKEGIRRSAKAVCLGVVYWLVRDQDRSIGAEGFGGSARRGASEEKRERRGN